MLKQYHSRARVQTAKRDHYEIIKRDQVTTYG